MDLSALLLLCLAVLSGAQETIRPLDAHTNATEKHKREKPECAGKGCEPLQKRENGGAKESGVVAKRAPYQQGDDKLQLYHLSLGVLEATAAYRNSMGYGSYGGYANGKTPNTFTEYLLSQGYMPGPYKVCAPPVYCPSGYATKFRTFDGSCNNPKYPRWGQAKTAFNRLLAPAYSDGVSYPRRSVYGGYLPSARKISAVLFDDKFAPDDLWTVMFMQFGQFISHDMSMSSKPHYGDQGVQCCTPDNSGALPPEMMHHACYPILIPHDDPFFSYFGQRCMNFVRSMTVAHPDCRLGPAEQMNTVSHFIDLSHVYGNSEQEANSLRLGKGGLLAYTYRDGRVVLPTHTTMKTACNKDCPASACYKGGDARINQNPGLALLHILFLRDHNRIASELYKINGHWDDERLFHETRRILVAVYQHIVYDEYLPIALGEDFVAAHNIVNGKEGYNAKSGYDAYVSPNVLNEHATAAFRYQHSTIHSFSELYGPGHYYNGSTRMSDHFECPAILEQGPLLDYYIRGMCTSPMQKADKFYSHEITWFLFRDGKPWGLDLESFDIQRSRDHGLRGYNDYRAMCGLPRAKYFDDLADLIAPEFIEKLAYMYKHVDDLDLTVAFLETHVKDALFGPTLRCIAGEQFYRSRVGDKYFFEHKGMPHSFSEDQIASIKKVTLAKLVCVNSDYIEEIQPDALHLITEKNKLVNCASLPGLDLGLWKEEPSYK
ncbi:peroxidase-like [Neocloeon triangulifer]|uniref:peroxidase-like n=1 Tax=Neocloeon triangulifer TaxID=2078957 RepID=UPI00286F6598|nr:peroxidase-like [Neocloeon triangulifer]